MLGGVGSIPIARVILMDLVHFCAIILPGEYECWFTRPLKVEDRTHTLGFNILNVLFWWFVAEATPDLIPNSEVKLCWGDDTLWRESS